MSSQFPNNWDYQQYRPHYGYSTSCPNTTTSDNSATYCSPPSINCYYRPDHTTHHTIGGPQWLTTHISTDCTLSQSVPLQLMPGVITAPSHLSQLGPTHSATNVLPYSEKLSPPGIPESVTLSTENTVVPGVLYSCRSPFGVDIDPIIHSEIQPPFFSSTSQSTNSNKQIASSAKCLKSPHVQLKSSPFINNELHPLDIPKNIFDQIRVLKRKPVIGPYNNTSLHSRTDDIPSIVNSLSQHFFQSDMLHSNTTPTDFIENKYLPTCQCWHGGYYCSTLAAGPAHLLWNGPYKESHVGHNCNSIKESPPIDTVGEHLSLDTPLPPEELRHYYIVESLRKAIRHVWTVCTLSEISSENSKMVVVDSRLPLYTVFRSLIEYKKSFVVIFCEDSGHLAGEFNVLDIIEYLTHYWLVTTDSGYSKRLCSILSEFGPPGVEFSPLPKQNIHSVEDHTQNLTRAISSSSASESLTTNEVGSSQFTPISKIKHPPIALSTTDKSSCHVQDTKEFSSIFPLASYDIEDTDFHRLTPVIPSETPNSGTEPISSQSELLNTTNITTGNDLFYKEQELVQEPHMDDTDETNKLIIATYVGQCHQSLLSRLPQWFSVRLLEYTTMTLEMFQLLQYHLSGSNHNTPIDDQIDKPISLYPYSKHTDLVSAFPKEILDTTAETSFDTISKENPHLFVSNNVSTQHDDNMFDKTNESSVIPKSRLYFPPPWIYTLDFWRRLSGVQTSSSLLSIHPDRAPLEAVLLLLEKRVSQVVVWNDDRSSPLHFLSAYSLLNHLLQHLRGHHSALDLYIRSDLGLGVTGDDIITVFPTTSLKKVFNIFRKYQWRCIPVIDPKSNSLLGFFSRSQIFALVAKILQYPRHSGSPHQFSSSYDYHKLNNSTFSDPSTTQQDSDIFHSSQGLHGLLPLDLNDSLEDVVTYFLGFSYSMALPFHSYKQRVNNSIFQQTDGTQSYVNTSQSPLGKSNYDHLINKNDSHSIESSTLYGRKDPTIDLLSTHNKTTSGYSELPMHTISPNDHNYAADMTKYHSSQIRHSTLLQGGNETIGSSLPTTTQTSMPAGSTGPPPNPLFSLNEHCFGGNSYPHGPSTTTGITPLAVFLKSHGISFQNASQSILNITIFSPAVIDDDMTLRDAISHILLTGEHRITLIDPIT